ncbi:phage-like element PBSX protein XkdJ [Bacillus sp. J14TS2]|nr:phage-like element PBSX protein XkdJ [Bacillus sp. J14TS2]
MAFLYNLFQVNVYDQELPENFAVPSLYVPTPSSSDGSDTVSTFRNDYVLPVKLFHVNTNRALEEAGKIATAIREDRYLIPLLDPSGASTGDMIRISKVETRRLDNGVALISITWNSRYFFRRPKAGSIDNFDIDSGVKE